MGDDAFSEAGNTSAVVKKHSKSRGCRRRGGGGGADLQRGHIGLCCSSEDAVLPMLPSPSTAPHPRSTSKRAMCGCGVADRACLSVGNLREKAEREQGSEECQAGGRGGHPQSP